MPYAPFGDGLWCHGLPQVPFISFTPHAAKQSSPPSGTGSPFTRHVPKLRMNLRGGVLACQRLSFMLRFAVFCAAKGRVLRSRCFCAGLQGALLVWHCGRASPRAGRPWCQVGAFCAMPDAGMPGVQSCPCVGRCSFLFVAGFAVRYALRPQVAQAWFIYRRIVRVFVNRFSPHRMSLPRVFQSRFCIKIGISCMFKS